MTDKLDKETLQRRKILEDAKMFSSKQRFQIAVAAGIYTPDGQLTERYRDDSDKTIKKAEMKKPIAPVKQWVDYSRRVEFVHKVLSKRLFLIDHPTHRDVEGLYFEIFPEEAEEYSRGEWRYDTKEYDFGEARLEWYMEEYSKPLKLSDFIKMVPDGYSIDDVEFDFEENSQISVWIVCSTKEKNPNFLNEKEFDLEQKRLDEEYIKKLADYEKKMKEWELFDTEQQVLNAQEKLKKLKGQ